MMKYKYLLLGLIITLSIVVYSCFSYYSLRFSYSDEYYKIKKYCYEKEDVDSSYCSSFKYNGKIDEKALSLYIKDSNPETIRKNMDVITATSEIVELTFFKNLQMFSPLIILIVVIGTLQTEFISGNFKNYLLRKDYKKYLKQKYKIVPIASLLMPIALISVFIFSCFLTNFNFDISNVNTNLAVYDEWKYNHFILYGISICIIQFFISLLYSHIGINCVYKNKNKIVSIVMGFLNFILVYIFIYVIIYIFIINKILGFKELTEYFNIIGYWFFDSNTNLLIVICLSFIFQFVSLIYVYFKYRNKEKLVLSYEKQIS